MIHCESSALNSALLMHACSTNSWSPVANMGTKRWGAGVAVMDKKLYVLGGMNGAERGLLPTVEVYDPGRCFAQPVCRALTDTAVKNSWSELKEGPKLARGSCTFAAL